MSTNNLLVHGNPAPKVDPKILKSVEDMTSTNPHTDDPRFLQTNQMNNCLLRYSMFCRCLRELGEDDTRCKWSYFRAQASCPGELVDLWNEHREKGSCQLDTLPDRAAMHMRF
eukprot:GDKH01012936.1.p3 GENE.GDKH01012936.1~~GDKH01012936.1.p3  ORF type:complete len:113 (-),score=13.33 GDKH01012936.1:298-636(-)